MSLKTAFVWVKNLWFVGNNINKLLAEMQEIKERLNSPDHYLKQWDWADKINQRKIEELKREADKSVGAKKEEIKALITQLEGMRTSNNELKQFNTDVITAMKELYKKYIDALEKRGLAEKQLKQSRLGVLSNIVPFPSALASGTYSSLGMQALLGGPLPTGLYVHNDNPLDLTEKLSQRNIKNPKEDK